VGNRALVRTANGVNTTRLINTDDGSIVASYANASPLHDSFPQAMSVSCDGRYGALRRWGIDDTNTVVIVDMATGAVLASDTTSLNSPWLGASFPCPLKGAGRAFNSGDPVSDGAVTWIQNTGTSTMSVVIWNLTSGQRVVSDTALATGGEWIPAVVLNCAQDTVGYLVRSASSVSGYAIRFARLIDGVTVQQEDVDPAFPPVSC